MEKVENKLKNEFRIYDKIEIDRLFDLVGEDRLSEKSLLIYFAIISNMDYENRLTLSLRKLAIYTSTEIDVLEDCIDELDSKGVLKIASRGIFVNPRIAVRSACMDKDVLDMFEDDDENNRSKMFHKLGLRTRK